MSNILAESFTPRRSTSPQIFKTHSTSLCQAILAAFMALSCISLASASAALSQRRHIGSRTTVSLYSSTSSGVLDPFWDSDGPRNLEHQLKLLKFNIAHFTGKPGADSIQPSTSTYVIPPITGDALYSENEDVQALQDFVNAGGLIILHESVRRPEAAHQLITQILGYDGVWQHCEPISDNARNPLGPLTASSFANDFIDVALPQQLEDVRAIQVRGSRPAEESASQLATLLTVTLIVIAPNRISHSHSPACANLSENANAELC
jgi:hypothetical protein